MDEGRRTTDEKRITNDNSRYTNYEPLLPILFNLQAVRGTVILDEFEEIITVPAALLLPHAGDL